MMSEFLSMLSDVQRSAAENFEGASLIIAGAGSGKTRVLTSRIAYMLEKGVNPAQILALTFTNKAAGEMRERISSVVNRDQARKLWMGTFHSVFSRILRAESELIGFPQSFTIYETSDSRNLVKIIIKEMNLNDDKYKPKNVFSRISLCKNNLVTPQMYKSNSTLISEDRESGCPEFSEVYREYMVRCKRNGAMDFDDLLLYTNILFRDFPNVVKKYQDVFRYILVDEYQDTNYAQYLIVRKISEGTGNICVVGDDAQSIYSFRGAKIENILRFQKDYPNAKVYKLEENYRSTQTIVNAANSIIKKNTQQLKKNVFSNGSVGEKITLCRAYADKEEAMMIADSIRTRIKEDSDEEYRNFAILYRTNAQSRAIEEYLRMKQIPYKIYGGISFYQRAEIKHILAYVRLVVNNNDDEALRRIINFPARGIGDTSLSKIADIARANSISMWDALKKFSPEQMEVRGAAIKRLGMFTDMIESMKSVVNNSDACQAVYEIAEKSGIIGTYKNDNSPESQSAYENIEELINSLKSQVEEAQKEDGNIFTVDEWLQNVTLITDMDTEKPEENNKVTLMTIHSAKGLEFKHLFIAGMEEGLFPSPRSAESLSSLEEERRLFYVAITRAIDTVTILFCLSRYKWGTQTNTVPSRFIKEIDSEYLDRPSLLNIRDYDEDQNIDDNESFPARKPLNSNIGNRTTILPRTFSSQHTEPKPTTGKVYEPARDMSKLKRVNQSASTPSASADNSVSELEVGSKVEHLKFGSGVIISLEKMQSDTKVTVKFASGEQKTLLLKFAKLKKL